MSPGTVRSGGRGGRTPSARAENEVEGVGELQPAGGLEEEDVEVAAALEVAEDKDNDVRLC